MPRTPTAAAQTWSEPKANMDKLQPILAAIKQYHFWVLTVIVALLGLIAWSAATASLTEQFEKSKKEVEGKKTSVNRIRGEADHPNDKIIDGMKGENLVLKTQVLKVWTQLYEAQREKVLSWPDDVLRPEFNDTMAELSFDEKIPDFLRGDYHFKAKKLAEQLPKIVEAQEVVLTSGSRRTGGAVSRRGGPGMFGRNGGRTELEENYIVIWTDFIDVYQKYLWDKQPISREIWVRQEDYWVYKNLLQIIAKTNEDASGPHNAAIRIINSIKIGSEAADDIDTRETVQFDGERAGGANAFDKFDKMRPPGRASLHDDGKRRGGSRGNADAQAIRAALFASRYLDDKGKPIAEPPADAPPPGEYRRLPIRLDLEMNVKNLPRLLVNCANAPLTVEPTQVTINPDQAPSARSGGGDRGGAHGRGGNVKQRRPAPTNHRPTVRGPGGGGTTLKDEPERAIANVVIQGIVYIYNPPDRATLGLGEQGESAVAAPSAGTGDGNSTSR